MMMTEAPIAALLCWPSVNIINSTEIGKRNNLLQWQLLRTAQQSLIHQRTIKYFTYGKYQ
uniref:Uncharacterized protein n=2 Tax=Arion vulgaris TaxID=1028688 RepID=A0A0B7AEY1_9EUPU